MKNVKLVLNKAIYFWYACLFLLIGGTLLACGAKRPQLGLELDVVKKVPVDITRGFSEEYLGGGEDSDDDDIDDNFLGEEDNCPLTPNGPGLGTCSSGNIGAICMSNSECDLGEIEGFCSINQEDTDSDGKGDVCDNCLNDYNPSQIDCDEDGEGDACDEDTIDFDGDGVDDGVGEGHGCDNCPEDYNPDQTDADTDGPGDACDNCPNDYNPGQEDTYPPGGNGCGDACECLGDFDGGGDVDGSDAILFKENFMRKDCSELLPCNGDFECDGDVDGTDAVKFKVDFFSKDCPSCGGWPCGY